MYISGRTTKISGALFEKECAHGHKILSGQMHPCNIENNHIELPGWTGQNINGILYVTIYNGLIRDIKWSHRFFFLQILI